MSVTHSQHCGSAGCEWNAARHWCFRLGTFDSLSSDSLGPGSLWFFVDGGWQSCCSVTFGLNTVAPVKHQRERVSQMPEFWMKVYFLFLSEERLRVRVWFRLLLPFVLPG